LQITLKVNSGNVQLLASALTANGVTATGGTVSGGFRSGTTATVRAWVAQGVFPPAMAPMALETATTSLAQKHMT
jgi:hypothetical protein